MTKQEAIEQMNDGAKITHRHFDKDEWMTIRYGRLVLEDGVKCSLETFFSFRTDESWNDGYELFTTKL